MKSKFKWIITLIMILGTMFLVGYEHDVQQQYATEVIRFHVIANSNSFADQTLKLHVRDAVVKEMKKKFIHVQNKKEALVIAQNSLEEMKKIAQAQVESEGKHYPVKVMLGDYPFPAKTYGDLTLPTGTYQAVRVIIGSGEGRNWWCVLFPPLCFVDGQQTLSNAERPKGYKVFENNHIEYRLRSLELLGIKN